MKIVNSSESNNTIKMLIYGSSGVGKTVFGSTAPDVLFLDVEAGTLSIADKKIDRVKIEKFSDIQEVYNFLKAGGHKYKTVVLDSLTETQKKSMDGILEKSGNEKPSIADWGTNIETIRKMVRAFRDLPINVIFISLEQVEKDEITGTVIRMPGLQGKTLPAEIMGYVDIVGYMVAQEQIDKATSVKSIIRLIRVQPGTNVSAKDRSAKLGTWVEPDFGKIYNTVFGEVKQVAESVMTMSQAGLSKPLANVTDKPKETMEQKFKKLGGGK